MKKLIALILLCVTVCGISCACASSRDDAETSSTSTSNSSTVTPMAPPQTSLTTPSIDNTSALHTSAPETTTPDVTTTPAPADPEPYYIVTAEEREMLAALVYLESSICSMDCQKAVASVVFNRLESGRWRKDVNKDGKVTLYDIVYYPNAFTPAGRINKTTPNAKAYEAVDYVIQNGPTVPTEVRYFRTDYDFKWDNYKNYCTMDNVYFGYFTNWKQGAW